ncbi:acyltransferase family protein [Pararoseomonas indoligenes]|uniref:Acyltransferase n=1 Tax=Roseomonas indoligenes TaxID=2820811 RepID=A0A940S699_9PROT|nr:acyltransferase [Pararoseomonas indoligenes]
MAARGNRVAFADQLRGIAALLVVIAHFGAVFWHNQPAVAEMTGLPPAFATPPAGLAFTIPILLGTFQFGAAGVALFFLISGYVIPFSLRGRSPGSFLVARLVRLMPTYWIGFALQALVILGVGRLLGGTFPRDPLDIVLNLLPGPHMLTGRPTLDGIVWTLDIEVWFYLLAALAAPALLARSAAFLLYPLGVGLAGAALALFPAWAGWPPGALRHAFAGLSLAAPMLLFMMVGTVLHLAEADARWRRAAFLVIPALLLAVALLLRWWPVARLDSQTPSYLAMAALFVAAHALRHRIPAWRWPTRLAAISYPLYVVHAVSGYAIMVVLTRWGWPPAATMAAALAYALLAATALHRLVEEPTRRLSARLGREEWIEARARAVAP